MKKWTKEIEINAPIDVAERQERGNKNMKHREGE